MRLKILLIVILCFLCASLHSEEDIKNKYYIEAIKSGLVINVDDLPVCSRLVINGEYEALKEIAENKQELLNQRDSFGQTAIFYAIDIKQYEYVNLLVEYNADLNVRTEFGETILMRAVSSGNKRIIRLILQHAVDVNAQDNFGRSTLHYAILNRDDEIIEYLLNSGGDCFIEDTNGVTPLILFDRQKNNNMANKCKR